MSSAMVRMPEELKSQLEDIKEKHHLKASYEAVEKLIIWTERQKQRIAELEAEKRAEQEKRESEYVYLGAERKAEILASAKELYLNESDMIEFLLACYDGDMTVSKLGLMKYAEIKGRNTKN